MTIAQELAGFVVETKQVPQASQDIAVCAILDLAGAAIGGYFSRGGKAAATAAPTIWGAGPAECWFSDIKLTVTGAAFSNAAIASMLDLDDGHRAAAGHPGASIIPAVLATADAFESTAEEILIATVIGYEIAIRIAASRDINKLDTLVTGPWCGQGAAAASAWLRRLPPLQVAQAISIAGSSAPNLAAIAYSQMMGNHVKEGIPWATATGIAAVELAAAGFTGPMDLMDNEHIYDRDKLTSELGSTWLIDSVYFKPYGCCRWSHAAMDAFLELRAREQFDLEDVHEINIHTFSRALRLNNDLAPKNLEAAQYSIPFCVALAALKGVKSLLPLTERWLNDREVLALTSRVTLAVDPKLDAMFSKAVPARIEVKTRSSVFANTVLVPKGEPDNPMVWDELVEKLRVVASDTVAVEKVDYLVGAIDSLRHGDSKPMLDALALPLDVKTGSPRC